MNTKKWYTSWTLWVNVLGVAVIILNHAALNGWLDPTTEALGLAIINFILRFKTNSSVTP